MARVAPGQLCPWCRSGAVTWRPWNSRTRGPFLGCSNFPNCSAAWNEDGSRLGWGWGVPRSGGRPLGGSGRIQAGSPPAGAWSLPGSRAVSQSYAGSGGGVRALLPSIQDLGGSGAGEVYAPARST
jgi:hypothetical protein